ncbi:MAG: TadE/TadG family type IV pilus assembly protein [Rhodospirillales bacterium]|jgi:Flp pilus assembly protein TadG|nr:TadE/TadG family type IV pilus assembly protein [Rhodospirillales bacterium]MDP6646703.1 TadE/TadG family type IV pilus assembly protein [Rhodospirillales bacterium]MDP6842594.1 TadE/TadG family type IV pilus assembly protein [Rhodospirillales bacterium]|tara:strand:+ start:871 stop:1431 length:561 start_codon:yes stop_codon:yes gene_type:complete
MSAIKHAYIGRLIGDQRGESLIGFAFVLPLLLLVSLGALEFTLVGFDFHRAGEATRRAARIAVIQDAVIDAADFSIGETATCTGTGTGVNCTGAGIGSAATFTAIVADMQSVFPSIAADNVQLVYSDSGLGDATTPGGIIPLVTVRLINFQRPFRLISGIPGMPDNFTFPSFETSQMGAGLGPASS